MRAVVVGAGTAGLVSALKLAEAGFEVRVVEREELIGGLAKSFKYRRFTFDIGPHRFFTSDTEVSELVNEVLGEGKVQIERRSGVYLSGKYYDWPLDIGAIFRLPVGIMLRAFIDLFRRPKAEPRTFRDYIVSKYGRTLYRLFFREYSHKFLGIPPEETDAEWARTGIDRAVIDPRVQADDLCSLAKGALLPRRVKTVFVYPVGGVGEFSEKLAQRARSLGVRIEPCSEVESIECSEGRLKSVDGERTDVLVWTGSVVRLAELLGIESPPLEYLSLVLYNIELGGGLERRLPYQWCYYGEGDLIFSRLSQPKLFWEGMVPEGSSSLCVEVTAVEGDERWRRAEALQERVVDDLRKVGVITEEVGAIHIERVREAYPLYRLGFLEKLTGLLEEISLRRGVYPAGRTGLFWYNNMDHSIRQALDLVEKIKSDALHT